MPDTLRITTLMVEAFASGDSNVRVNVTCETIDDVVDLIEWLKLAKDVMAKWEAIRSETQTEAMTNKMTAIREEAEAAKAMKP